MASLPADALAPWILGGLLLINLLTGLAYALDKRAARRGDRRIRERTLHLWALAGGWPAAWLAQRALRHKCAKPAFQRVYWLTVLVHCAATVAWLGGWLGP